MAAKKAKDVVKIFAEGTAIDRALRTAGREALLRHKKLGQSVVVWRDGKVVRVLPEDISVGTKGNGCRTTTPRRTTRGGPGHTSG